MRKITQEQKQISDDYYVSFSDSVDSTENYYIEHLLYDKEFKS